MSLVVYFSILIYFFFICLTGAVIFAAFKLTKTYPYRFLGHFLYFLILFFIYGFLGFSANGFDLLLSIPAAHPLEMRSFLLLVLLAPVQVLYIYFFLLWGTELLEISLPKWFKWAYFSIQLILFIPAILRYATMLNAGDQGLSWPGVSLFGRFGPVLFYLAMIYLYIAARAQQNERKRSLAKAMVLFYIVGYPIMFICDRGLFANDIITLVLSIPIFFSVNILPLLYLKSFLKKAPLETARPPLADTDLQEYSNRNNLTKREQEILGLIMTGKGTREIGKDLFISEKTVRNNITNIFVKTGARNRVQLISFVHNTRR